MSTPYDSHFTPMFTPPNGGGRCLAISCLLRLICFIALLMAVCEMDARTTVSPEAQVVADSTEIYFRQSSSSLDFGLDANGEHLDNLLRQIQNVTGQDSTFVISTLRVIGSASPEGSEQINRLLSEKRARTLFDYIAAHVSLPDSITDIEYLGRNLRGLYSLVASDSSVPSQTEVLALLKKAVSGPELSTAESNRLLYQLKTLNDGKPYAYMYRHLFPALRYSFLYVEYEKRANREIDQFVLKAIEADNNALSDSAATERVTADVYVTEEILTDEFTSKTSRPFWMDIRTNMLYDVVAVPNIGAEFYLGKNISVLANWMYGWWDKDSRHRYWRIYGGELGARWWFGRKADAKPLTGHHLGVYAGVLTFDFEWGGTGYMGGKPGGTLWDCCLVNSGIEYGYSLPVGKRLNIDFTIGLGYFGGNYIKYFPFDNDYYREKEYKMRFFGPTKAEISLVWLIGRDNTNKRKGGEI